jgi:hypothetical protein
MLGWHCPQNAGRGYTGQGARKEQTMADCQAGRVETQGTLRSGEKQ